MNLDTRRLLNAARYGRLYDNADGVTLVRQLSTSGLTPHRAQRKLVEQLLDDGWLAREGNGIYQLTKTGLARLVPAEVPDAS